MRVAVCVPARDEEKNLGACLEAIVNQTLSPIEIFVVNDGSTDRTAAIATDFAERDARFRVIETGGVGPSTGRNIAIARTATDFIAFTDADAIPKSDWLASLIAALPLNDASIVGVGGAQAVPDDASSYERSVHSFLATFGFVSEYLRTDAHVVATRHIPSVNALYRVESLRAVGGFREGLFPCEDLDLDRRLLARGGRLLFTPSAIVAHHRPASPAAFRRMMRSYGRGHAQLIRIHGPYRVLHAMPFAVAAGALGVMVAPLPTFGFAIPAGLAGLAALSLKLRSPARATLISKMLAVAVLEWHRGFIEGFKKHRPCSLRR